MIHDCLEGDHSGDSVRSECIGFMAFLHKMKVSGWTTNGILYCPLHEKRKLLKESGSQDYRVMTSSARGLKAISKWVIVMGPLDHQGVAPLDYPP